MKISFDLDDTPIPGNLADFPTEKRNFLQRLFGIELLRKGTVDLLRDLKAKGHSIGIYTTSYRSWMMIKIQFISYGVPIDFIINEEKNRAALKMNNITSSKYPPAFGIDIHIDDSEGVEIEGKRLNFMPVIISKGDLNWIHTIYAHT